MECPPCADSDKSVTPRQIVDDPPAKQTPRVAEGKYNHLRAFAARHHLDADLCALVSAGHISLEQALRTQQQALRTQETARILPLLRDNAASEQELRYLSAGTRRKCNEQCR